MRGEGTGGNNGSPRPTVAAPAASPGGENMTLNFSISLPGSNGSGLVTGAEQTVQFSVSLSRSPSSQQLVGAATAMDNGFAAAPVAASALSQIDEGGGSSLGPTANEEEYAVSSEGWNGEGQQAEATYANEDDAEYDTGVDPQSTNHTYPVEGASAEEARTSLSLDPGQFEEGMDPGQGEGLARQQGEENYYALEGEGAESQWQQEAYTDEGGARQEGWNEPTVYAEAYGAQEGYEENRDEYHMAEAGLQAQDGAGYGNGDGEEVVVPEYKRKSVGLSVATTHSARVYVAPPDALSPTTYDYNKDMWGDMWAYDAPNPAQAASALQDDGMGEEESDDDEGDENLGDDFEDTPWRPPSHDKAKEYRARVVFEEGAAPLCRGVHLSDLGLGITLYFRFLKALIALFSLLLLLSIPSFSLYSSGSRIPADKRDALGFYAATLGNLGSVGEDGRYVAFLGGSALSLSSAGSVVGTMDLFSSIAYALMVLAMGWEVRRRTRKGTSLTAKDFAVYVTGFPRDARKEAIIEHFSRLYPLNDFDWKGRPPVLGRLREPVRDTANTSDDRYVGKWVCEVTLARRNGRKLRTFLLNDEKNLQLKRIRAHMKMYSPNTPLLDGRGANEDQYQAFEKKLNELGAEMETVAERLAKDKQLARVEKDCVGAFMIFEYVESKRRCLQDYSWTSVNRWCRHPKPLLFENRRLTVRPAADPEDVWWENLEVSWWERFLRRSVANVVMAVFLIVSFAVVISLTGAKQRQTDNAPKLSFCAKEVPALFLGSYANSTSGLSLVSPSPFDCAECDTQCSELWSNAGYVVYSYHDSALRPARPYSVAACLTSPCPDPSRASQCPCVVPSGNAMCSTLACSQPTEGHRCQTFKSRTLAGCYCSFRLDTLVAEAGYLSALLSLLRDNLCSSFATSIGLSMGLQVLLSVSTLAVNALLTHVTHSLTSFEHNASSDTQAAQVIRKVFVASYLNTAILLLLAYGSLQGTGPLVRAVRGVGILAGQYADFSVNWYADVGVQLCVTSLIAALSPHIEPLLQYFGLMPLHRMMARRAAASGRPSHVMQADLNGLYVGPRFDVTERYPQVLNLLFFTMTFSTGLPLMTLFALLSFVLCYVVDRFLLLRFYRRPPQRDERLQRTINRMLPYALLLHLGISVWMLGNADILHGDTVAGSLLSESLSGGRSVSERIVRPYVFPLFLFWVLLLLYLLAVDVLPSQTLSNALAALKSLLKGTHAQSQSSGALLANGYTKVFERELPRDFKDSDLAGPEGKWNGWATCTYDDGSSVLRKLRGAPGTSRHGNPKSPEASAAAAAAAAASPNGRAMYRRTWEVIKVNALHTYALCRNPKYRGAVMTFFKEFQQQQGEP